MKEFLKVSQSGGINIPIKLRREYGINNGDGVSIRPLEGGGFEVKPYIDRCCLCGNTENVKYILGKGICIECAEKAMEIFKGAEANE